MTDIEQYKLFRQDVSDELRKYFSSAAFFPDCFRRFLIAKPDPLVDAIAIADCQVWHSAAEYADNLRAALDAGGLEIREKGA